VFNLFYIPAVMGIDVGCVGVDLMVGGFVSFGGMVLAADRRYLRLVTLFI
jgi:hypothetical protein